VALIDVDEGFRMMAGSRHIPEHVRIGMRVQFRVHRPAAMNHPARLHPAETRDAWVAARRRGHRRRRGIDLGAVADLMSPIDLMAQGIQRAWWIAA